MTRLPTEAAPLAPFFVLLFAVFFHALSWLPQCDALHDDRDRWQYARDGRPFRAARPHDV